MILKIETEIFGNFNIEKDLEIFLYPYTINIVFESIKNIYLISISSKISNYEKYLPNTTIKDNKIIEVEFPKEDFIEEQINILKHIESFGSIDCNISKIDWENCSVEWINEENESYEMPIRKYRRNINYVNIAPNTITKNWLTNTLIHKKRLEHLTLPFSFFREGANLYYSLQYQNSFINFFFMLEGFFGNNQFKKEKLKEEFINSDILTYAIENTLKSLNNEKGKHFEWLIKELKNFNKQFNKEGVVHIIVEYRGKFSHFVSGKSNMKNPFKDRDYHSLAYLTMRLCIFASVKLRIEPFKSK